MTPGLGFALGAMLCFGASDLVYKRAAAAGIQPKHFAMLQAWVFLPGVTTYAWATGTLDPHASALWGGLAGGFLLIAVTNFIASLKSGAVSTNAPIFRLNFTLTAALAILLLGEMLTLMKLAALACALVAVWLLLAEPGRATSGRVDLRSLARVLLATAAMAFANFCHKVGLTQGALPETMVAAQAWVFCSLATLNALIGDRGYRVPARAWPYAASAAVLLIGGFFFMLDGLALGPASVLVPVTQMSFVFTALLGALIFHEALNARKRVGLAVAAAALVLFAIS